MQAVGYGALGSFDDPPSGNAWGVVISLVPAVGGVLLFERLARDRFRRRISIRRDYIRYVRPDQHRAAALLGRGVPQKDVAAELGVAPRTVRRWAADPEFVVQAQSVQDANAVLRERFAAIFVDSRPGGGARLDFVLSEREPGAPLVSSRLWADAEVPDDGSLLVDFVQVAPTTSDEQTDALTFVNRSVWRHMTLPALDCLCPRGRNAIRQEAVVRHGNDPLSACSRRLRTPAMATVHWYGSATRPPRGTPDGERP